MTGKERIISREFFCEGAMRGLDISENELALLVETAADLAKRYWASLPALPSYPQTSGSQTAGLFTRPWLEEGLGKAVLDDFKEIAAHSRPAGGRFFGYVVGSGEPVGAAGDFLASVLNQNATAWRSAPAAVSVEQSVVTWLAEAVGCGGFRGSLCGGGSAANLMGLALAREAKLPANETGVREPGAIYVSEQAHFSIVKAAALLGIGRNNVRLIPVDGSFGMDVAALERAIAADRSAGRHPLAIVATAGSVATGAIDPLPAIADIAERENTWMHVDGAFGALAALAVPEQFEGMERADSLSLDAHKWLYQPLDCGCLLYRDPGAARRAFSQSADYVKTFNTDPTEIFSFFDESMELSRRFRALKLWFSLQYHGRRAFREAIARDLDHARLLHRLVQSQPDLEVLAGVPLSAVCFRHRHRDNEALLRRLIARGNVYLSNATIHGQFALRACFVNHRTREEDVQMIVPEVLAAAAELA
jgi:glutamate/tyrosine decarboxylase-like PLP-dependent enzyme